MAGKRSLMVPQDNWFIHSLSRTNVRWKHFFKCNSRI